MKLFLSTLLLLLLSPIAIFAETINTGNAYVNTSVSTNTNDGSVHTSVKTSVQSSGESSVSVNSNVESKSSSTSTTTSNTYKKIEVTVNGEKKVVESNEPGEIKVEVGTKTPTPKIKLSATPFPLNNPMGEGISGWVKKFIADLFSKIFK